MEGLNVKGEPNKEFSQTELKPVATSTFDNFFQSNQAGVLNLYNGQMQSPNYVPNMIGWKVDSDGNAEFQSLTTTLSRVIKNYTASEAITLGDAVSIGDATQYLLAQNTTAGTTEVIRDTAWYSQSFTTSAGGKSIHSVVLKFFGVPAGNTSTTHAAAIYASSGGKPTGSALGTKSQTENINNGGTICTFTFASPVAISPSTVYHVVISDTRSDNNITIARDNTAGQGTNKSTDSGANWSGNNGPLYYQVNEIDTVSGQICRSTSIGPTRARDKNFIGFANSAITSGSSGPITISGEPTSVSGLTPGQYYLSDTRGAISTSAGTVTRKVGIATSATSLIITNVW